MQKREYISQMCWALAAAICLLAVPSMAAPFTASSSGTWDSSSTWGGAGVPGSGDTISWAVGDLDVQVDSVETFSGGTFNVTNGLNALQFNSGTLTLDAGTFTFSQSSTWNNLGTDNQFIIADGATFAQTAGVLNNRNDISFINNGQMNLSGGSYLFHLGSASGINVLQNNGSFTVSGDYAFGAATDDLTYSFDNTATGTILADGATLSITVHFNDTAGTISATNGGIVAFTDPDRLYNLTNTTLSTDTGNGSQIQLGGKVGDWSGAIVAGSDVAIAKAFTAGQTNATIDFGSTEITWVGNSVNNLINTSGDGRFVVFKSPVRLTGGTAFVTSTDNTNGLGGLRIAAGNTFIVDSLFLATKAGTSIGCMLDNQGTMIVSNEMRIASGTIFTNSGLLILSQWIKSQNSYGQIDNTGTIRVDATGGNSSGSILLGHTLTQYNGSNTLSGGTWEVLAGANTGTLNVNPADAGITVIGADATIRLSGANATFSELSTAGLTVNGTFGTRDQKIHSLSADLSMGSGGILEFGLEVADKGGTLLTGLDITGDVTLTDGLVDIVDMGDMTEGTYRLMEFNSISAGTLTLNNTPANAFIYQLVHNADSVELTVSTTPKGTVISIR